MLRIGITGGIGTGKSTIGRIFELLGIPVYDADSQAKKLMVNNSALKKSIINVFGKDSYLGDELNREYLGEKIFKDEKRVNQLNALVHPAVALDFKYWCSDKELKYVIKEAALLFETGSYQDLDFTILVVAPEDLRINRIKKRDPQRSKELIQNIIDNQIDVEKAKSYADFIIFNDETHMIIPQVLTIHDRIIKKGLTH